MADLVDVDVVALSRRFLSAHERLTEALGGEGRVASLNEPPYPRVRLSDPPGDDRDLTHLIAPLLQIEVLGDPGLSGQKPMLRTALYVALMAMRGLPEAQALGTFPLLPGDAVVTAVTSTGGGGFVPEPPNQPRYIATLRLHAHPQSTPQT